MKYLQVICLCMVILCVLQGFDEVSAKGGKSKKRGRGRGGNTDSRDSSQTRSSEESSQTRSSEEYSQTRSSEEDECRGLRSYCENEDTCAYTFLVEDDDECPDVREVLADVQGLTETVQSNTQAIDLLTAEKEVLEILLDSLENEVAAQMTLISELRAEQEEIRQIYDAKYWSLLRKHRFQARQIQRLIDGLEQNETEEPPTSPYPYMTTPAVPTPDDRRQDLLVMVPSINKMEIDVDYPSQTEYIQQIEDLLQVYKYASDIDDYLNCPPGSPPRSEFRRKCFFSLKAIGEFCQTPDYGYSIGQPCVFFYIKTPGWRPRNYRRGKIPEEIMDFYDPQAIPVTCNAKTNEGQTDLGTWDYFNQNNIEFKYFPYVIERDGELPYLAPLMAVRFNITHNTLVHVQCKAWAQNIHHSMGHGIVNFDILINAH